VLILNEFHAGGDMILIQGYIVMYFVLRLVSCHKIFDPQGIDGSMARLIN